MALPGYMWVEPAVLPAWVTQGKRTTHRDTSGQSNTTSPHGLIRGFMANSKLNLASSGRSIGRVHAKPRLSRS